MNNTRSAFSGQWLPPRKHPIYARDAQAGDHHLVVIQHPHGLVSISDDEMIRILTPADAIRLIRQLAEAIAVPSGLLT